MMRPESGVEGAARGWEGERARKERRTQLIEAITLWAPPPGLPGEGRKDGRTTKTNGRTRGRRRRGRNIAETLSWRRGGDMEG